MKRYRIVPKKSWGGVIYYDIQYSFGWIFDIWHDIAHPQPYERNYDWTKDLKKAEQEIVDRIKSDQAERRKEIEHRIWRKNNPPIYPK